MRIFNVDAINPADVPGFTDQLMPGETVRAAFASETTTILFTERRIVTIQLQVLLTERLETSSFSWRAMRQFSMLQGAASEGRSELKIWLGADPQPLHLRAGEDTDLASLHRLLVEKLD